MKAEDKIVELLAEYLHKTDRLLDSMEMTDKNMDRVGKNIDIMSKAILEQNSKFNLINQRIDKSSHIQEAILNEILSISKRVSILENKG